MSIEGGKVTAAFGNKIPTIAKTDITAVLKTAEQIKENALKLLNDKSKWLAIFFFGLSIFLIWIITVYIYNN